MEPPGEGETTDFCYVSAETPEEACKKAVTLACERIPKRFGFDASRDI